LEIQVFIIFNDPITESTHGSNELSIRTDDVTQGEENYFSHREGFASGGRKTEKASCDWTKNIFSQKRKSMLKRKKGTKAFLCLLWENCRKCVPSTWFFFSHSLGRERLRLSDHFL